MRLKIDYAKSKEFNWTLTDDTNTPIDLTNLTGTFKVWLDIPGEDNVADISKTVTLDDAVNGECSVTIKDIESNITPAVYKYELSFDYTHDTNKVYDSGTFQVIGDDTIRLNEIKSKYGFGYDYYTMRSAMNYARAQVNKNGFVSEKATRLYTDSNNIIQICNYVMDSNFDGTVDKDDIEIYEYLTESPYTTNNLNANILSINFDHPSGKTFITMDGTYPTQGYTLQLKYSRGAKPYTEALETIEYLEELFVIKHLFNTLEINKLQRGMTNRSINGVDITFDKTAIDEYLTKLQVMIQNETMKIKPFTICDLNGFSDSSTPLARSVRISKMY